jgi:hypothetical protein
MSIVEFIGSNLNSFLIAGAKLLPNGFVFWLQQRVDVVLSLISTVHVL